MKSTATYTLAEIIERTGLQFTNYLHPGWLKTVVTGIWNHEEAGPSEMTFITGSGSSNAAFAITDRTGFPGSLTKPLLHPRPRYAAAKVAGLWADPSLPCVTTGRNFVSGPGVVLGGDGFGFEWDESTQSYFKFPHLGWVIIGDDVEIQSNSNVDRGVLSDTRIGSGTKIDSLVHIGHNAQIGQNVMITAGSVVGGSVTIGDHAWIGINSVIMQGVTIGEGATVGIGTTVLRDVAPGETVVGIHRVIESSPRQRGVIR